MNFEKDLKELRELAQRQKQQVDAFTQAYLMTLGAIGYIEKKMKEDKK